MNEDMQFPPTYWDSKMRAYIGIIRVFENPAWKNISIPLAPDTKELISCEIEDLKSKQADNLELEVRIPEIMEEADNVSPKIFRSLMFNANSHPRTAEIVTAMVIAGRPMVMHFKEKFARARPCQLDSEIFPLLDVPGHPAYPSGHSFQMHLIAHSLSEIAPWAKTSLFKIAGRVAENREWAGLHYASDTYAGKQLASQAYPIYRKAFNEAFEGAKAEWVR